MKERMDAVIEAAIRTGKIVGTVVIVKLRLAVHATSGKIRVQQNLSFSMV
ncbi:hypothetical protein [Rhizobium sp. ZPR3]|uniref:Uncharacterized protein n=2 Tax=unclassified Rhizobium TaxID=2613769 RepID=A0AAU7SRD4_9HYPH